MFNIFITYTQFNLGQYITFLPRDTSVGSLKYRRYPR